jgi:hypothetical protein
MQALFKFPQAVFGVPVRDVVLASPHTWVCFQGVEVEQPISIWYHAGHNVRPRVTPVREVESMPTHHCIATHHQQVRNSLALGSDHHDDAISVPLLAHRDQVTVAVTRL